GGGRRRFVERQPFYPHIARSQQFVRPGFHPMGHIGIGRPSVRRVVLEASVFWWIVRWRNHNAIREMFFTIAVVYKNGARDHRGWRDAVVLLNDGLHAVRREHLKGG